VHLQGKRSGTPEWQNQRKGRKEMSKMRKWVLGMIVGVMLPVHLGQTGGLVYAQNGSTDETIIHRVLLPVVMKSWSSSTVANPRQKPEDFQAGMAVVIYGNDQEFEVKTRELLDYLASLGANSLCLVFPLFQDNWTSSTVWVDEELTPSKERIRLFIRESHKRGFTVMLRPLLNEGSLVPDGKWRGSIQPQDIEAWFSSYGNIVLRYAKLAEEEGVEIFDIGTELTSLEGETNQWLKLIGAVRSVYHGQLTYSLNWWRLSYNVDVWDKLDFISVDAYFALDAPLEATVEQLIAAWQPWIEQLAQSKTSLNKPLVFTELGTTSQTGSHQRPWVGEHNTPLDLEAQRRYYAAACQASLSLVNGIYWWSVGLDIPSDPKEDRGFNPLGKPAETEIRECFRGR